MEKTAWKTVYHIITDTGIDTKAQGCLNFTMLKIECIYRKKDGL